VRSSEPTAIISAFIAIHFNLEPFGWRKQQDKQSCLCAFCSAFVDAARIGHAMGGKKQEARSKKQEARSKKQEARSKKQEASCLQEMSCGGSKKKRRRPYVSGPMPPLLHQENETTCLN
jgi:hypothetical protein